MTIPDGVMWILGALSILFIVFTVATMFVVYEAATAAREYFQRENQREREAEWKRDASRGVRR